MRMHILSMCLAVAVMLIGCDRKPDAGKPMTTSPAGAPKHDDHFGHDHSAEEPTSPGAGHGGEIVVLGTTKVGDVIVRAARDKGEIKPGDDTPIDVWLTTADGKPATVIAVRLWIGTEDAKGSIKAKADVEDPNQPSHWHTYGEAPEPIPLEAKLWVEIEPTSGSKLVCSFDLKV